MALEVSGTYTITNVATDSVQGLLSSVETAFGNQVTAAINASGQIVVTDKTSGSSSVALTFDYDTGAQPRFWNGSDHQCGRPEGALCHGHHGFRRCRQSSGPDP